MYAYLINLSLEGLNFISSDASHSCLHHGPNLLWYFTFIKKNLSDTDFLCENQGPKMEKERINYDLEQD